MKQELKDIEDQILYRLSASEGNPVDNVELIDVLQQSKAKATELTVFRTFNFYFFNFLFHIGKNGNC